MDACLISLELPVLQLIRRVLEPYLEMRQVRLVSQDVTDGASSPNY